VGLGAVFADVLADLKISEAPDNRRADDQPNEESGKAGEGSAKGQIAEDSERADMKYDETLLVEQPIEQIVPRL
jgi:hypothetical protein